MIKRVGSLANELLVSQELLALGADIYGYHFISQSSTMVSLRNIDVKGDTYSPRTSGGVIFFGHFFGWVLLWSFKCQQTVQFSIQNGRSALTAGNLRFPSDARSQSGGYAVAFCNGALRIT